MAKPAAHPPGAPDGGEISPARGRVEDRELARRAVAGDGDAFAELYDRHERRVYGFCMRMLGAPHDAADATQETFVRMLGRLPAMHGRELNFVAYALACARNACYDMIEGRRRVEPTAGQPDGASLGAGAAAQGDIALDPERAALLAAAREGVRAANAELPARQREVLALREIELLSYDEIGEIMGLNRNAVAQLVSRARIKLRDLLRGSELASVAAASPECERAQPLLASMQDDQPGARGELAWARAHLGGCETCRLSRAAMEEAGVSYRALAPLVPAAWLRHAAIARAAEFVGADWSHLAGGGIQTGGGPATDTGLASRSSEYSTAAASGLAARPTAGWRRRPRRLAWLLAAAALLALGIVVVAMAGGTRDGPGRSLSSQSAPASVRAIGPAATGGAIRKHRSLPVAGSRGSPGLGTLGAVVHAGTDVSPTAASHGSRTRRADALHRRRSASGRRSPPASSTPTATASPPPSPSPTATAPATTTPAPAPATTAPPAQTTPEEPAPPAPTPGGSTGTGTTPTTPPETPRGGGLIP